MKKLIMIITLFLTSCVAPKDKFIVKFIELPCVKPHDNYNYLTCSNLIFQVNDQIIIIPKGFKSDFASVPKILWPIYAPQKAEYVYPAICHDYLYTYHLNFKRNEIDDIFYQALLACNVNKFTAYKFYLSVRLFGSQHFDN